MLFGCSGNAAKDRQEAGAYAVMVLMAFLVDAVRRDTAAPGRYGHRNGIPPAILLTWPEPVSSLPGAVPSLALTTTSPYPPKSASAMVALNGLRPATGSCSPCTAAGLHGSVASAVVPALGRILNSADGHERCGKLG